jgi:hypothetical protein
MRIVYLILLLVLLSSCSTRMMEPPEDLIEESVFSDILYDVAVLKAVHSTSPATLESQGILIMPYIYEKYDVDSLQLINSNKYYSTLGDRYLKLFESIETRLAEKSEVIDSLRASAASKPQRM